MTASVTNTERHAGRLLLAAVALLAICGATAVAIVFAPVVLSGVAVWGTVCDTGEQDYVSHPPGSCPRTIIPDRMADSARLTIEVESPGPEWIEGGYFFARATSTDDRIVLEQRMESLSLNAYLPPGTYELTVYGRACGGWCGSLDRPSYFCTYDLTASPNQQLKITHYWSRCN